MTNLNTRHNPHASLSPARAALLLLALLAALLSAPRSHAQREDPLGDLTRGQRDQFRTYTRLFCRQFYRYGDDRFVLLPNYTRDRENSTGKSVDQVTEEMTLTQTVRRNGADVTLHYPPPDGEVTAAAMIIPAFDVGHYGYVSSFRVREVIGEQEMIVTRPIFIRGEDVPNGRNERVEFRRALVQRQSQVADLSFRLLGFDTAGLEPGDLFTGNNDRGIQVAVMSTDPQYDFVLVNYRRLRPVRTSEFADALAYVEISPVAFIDMVRDNRERYEVDGDKKSLLTIYNRYYDRYRPARLSRVAAHREEQEDPTPQTATNQGDPEPQPQGNADDPPQGDDTPATDTDQTDTHADGGSENDYEPEPDFVPDPDTRRDPEPQRDRDPREAEDEDDDWEYRERNRDRDEEPNFFGIPL